MTAPSSAPQRSSIAPQQLATPSGFTSEAVQAITDALNPLVADAFALYVKTKNFHWHLSSSHFRDYHLLFDEHADQIFATIDILAERVRRVGGTTIRSIGHIGKLQTIQDDDTAFVSPADMLHSLMDDNAHLAKQQRAAHEVCEQYGDVASASALETIIDETERRTWFLFEAYQGASNAS